MSGSFAASLKQLWHKLGSPRWFYQITHNWVRGFGAMAAVMLVVGCVWGLAFAPPDYQQGNSFRIMYVHVPAAMVAQSLYLGMGVAGFIGLVWRMKLADVAIAATPPAWYHPHCAGLVLRECLGPSYLGQLVGVGWAHCVDAGYAISVSGDIRAA